MANETNTSDHFTAIISIVKVTEVKITDSFSKSQVGSGRTKRNLAKIIVSDIDLEDLIDKANRHLQLVEDKGDIDD
jgi:hypothetical protein